jgi:hypothetical protein
MGSGEAHGGGDYGWALLSFIFPDLLWVWLHGFMDHELAVVAGNWKHRNSLERFLFFFFLLLHF